MNINKFTQKSMQAVQDCEKLAYQYGNQEIDQEHLIVALLHQEDSLFAKLITKMDIQLEYFENRAVQTLEKKVKVSGGNGQLYVSNALNKVLVSAEDEAKAMGDEYVSVEHLVLSLIRYPNNDVKELYKAKMDELCISSDVNFLGRLSRDEFRNRQMTWDMYVQTSVCEGMGNSVVDAMSMGLPIMISNTGYVAEAAQEHFPQIVFSSLNPHSMADELSILVSLKDRDFRYGNFYSMFFSGITPSKIASRWKQFLECDTPKTNFEYKPSAVLSLTLHDVSGDKHDNITTPVEVFESFVDRVHQKGLGLCSMKSYVQKSIDERERWIVCTFDDGYTGLLDNALPILNKYGFTASVYVCTDYLGKSNDWNFKDKSRRMHLNVEELKELICAGWEIGSHGVTHESLLRWDDADIEWQLKESKKILEELFGPVISYAYPYGDISPYIETQVKKYYDYAFLLTQGGVFLNTDAHKIHRYYISEINQIINGL